MDVSGLTASNGAAEEEEEVGELLPSLTTKSLIHNLSAALGPSASASNSHLFVICTQVLFSLKPTWKSLSQSLEKSLLSNNLHHNFRETTETLLLDTWFTLSSLRVDGDKSENVTNV